MRPSRLPIALLLLAVLVLASSGAATAHKTAYTADGNVRITWGFLSEPAVTWTKTGLDLILRDNATGAPIEGAEKTLNASLVLGGDSHAFRLAAQHGADKKGYYTDVVTLTRPGLYSLRLTGAINGSEVDLTIPAQHEVNDVAQTYFPDADGPSQLAARIKALEDQVSALRATQKTQVDTPAPVTTQKNDTPALGLLPVLGLLGVAALLARRRHG